MIVLMLLCSGVVSMNSADFIGETSFRRLLVKPFLLLSTHLLLVNGEVFTSLKRAERSDFSQYLEEGRGMQVIRIRSLKL